MIVLQAPHESIQTTTLLPNPEFSDSENLEDELLLMRAIDGTPYTHIKTHNRRKLIYDFDITRAKSLELIEFLKAYKKYNIRLTNFKEEVWVVQLVSDLDDITARTRGEYQTLRLEFEGEQISG